MEHGKAEGAPLHEDFNIAKIAEFLREVSGRIDSLEKSVSGIEAIVQKLPAMMAITTDAADEYCRNAAKSGIDIDERLSKAGELLIRLTDPKKIDAISQVIKKIDNLTSLIVDKSCK